ncbi:amidase [Labrys wisconsinensis]|uniref:Aspartyl-tRNA(Asn)/glutamyl-tRNA(Gln) amidotransferase subunit A n=1 Tax=Labrys wisconsinensis TaxID=425677 RepID=A0ABU0JF98_9HYPH|nr:amidase [Labrys wisconsinensis]MDQ0472171.1 aspartyl-tRNA(Asn)/glutamyl-tRNA(Gln) amidotransferase subunit A [Labrys wisconsinensis]
MAIDIQGKSALQLAALLQAGALDAVALAEATLAAIETCDDRAIVIRPTPDRALKEAHAASRRLRDGRARSLLDGVPIGWKDLFDLEGEVTTVGSRVLAADPPAARDAAVVARLKEAGMVSVGRLNMTEFAFSGIGLNPHYGTPRNPHGRDTPRIPGGSSSASGVAVAKGLLPVAMGTDTGGSVRIPAAYNGVVGYKATRGRYPMDGVFPLATSLDSLGPLCRTVEDAVLVDAAMLGLPGPVIARGGLDDLRLVVPANVVLDDLKPAVATAFEAALGRLAARGARIERLNLPAFDALAELTRARGALVTAEAYAQHIERLTGPAAEEIDQRVVARARLGANISLPDYRAIIEARGRLIAETDALVGRETLVAFPTIAHVAPPIAALEEDVELFFKVNARTLRNTALGNFLDWCGVSIPCGTGEAGMPVGFLLSGLAGEDERLLAAALAAEATIRGD